MARFLFPPIRLGVGLLGPEPHTSTLQHTSQIIHGVPAGARVDAPPVCRLFLQPAGRARPLIREQSA